MREELSYQGRLTKGNIYDIYKEAIHRVWPLSVFSERGLTYSSVFVFGEPGLTSFNMHNGNWSLIDVAEHLLHVRDPPISCIMERTLKYASPFGFKNLRRIELKANPSERTIDAIIEDTPKGILRVKNTLNKTLGLQGVSSFLYRVFEDVADNKREERVRDVEYVEDNELPRLT